MRCTSLFLLGSVGLGLALALAGVARGTARDPCRPATFTARCGPRTGTVLRCVRVDRDQYLFGLARPHHEVASVTCPGGAPRCSEAAGAARCTAK